MQKKYQPQLRKEIKIAVDLVNSVKQDAKDGDVDIRVRIAPNDTFKVIAINFIETTDEDELAKITPDDRFFIEGVQDKVDTILIQNTTEVEGKNNASKAVFDTIQTEVQILVDEYKLDLKYGDISMKLLGGGDDRRLNFIRTYTKDQKEIIVNLGHVKVDLEKIIKEKENVQPVDKGYPVPKDYGPEPIAERSKTKQRIYKHKKKRLYISRDIADEGESHSGGIWKMATSPANLNSNKTRLGTYNQDLERIAD